MSKVAATNVCNASWGVDNASRISATQMAEILQRVSVPVYPIGMKNAAFEDPTGLTSKNVASAEDLAILVNAAYQYPLIRQFTITPNHIKEINQREQQFLNSNRLVRSGDMEVLIQKTGYIAEAGRCLVMMALVNNRPYTMVFLDSVGLQSRFADAIRVKEWIESSEHATLRKLPNTKIIAN
jgi:D-alanyl-D-alanine endopeptidase (penicillin-binding protein 7)